MWYQPIIDSKNKVLATTYINQIIYPVQIVLVVFSEKMPIIFFFECSKYNDITSDLLTCVNRFGIKIDIALLTKGNQHLTYF